MKLFVTKLEKFIGAEFALLSDCAERDSGAAIRSKAAKVP
jgi:hypothetical protein